MEDAKEVLIRDIFAVYDEIAQKFIGNSLGENIQITMVAKEYETPAGRSDLLFVGSDDVLYLVELKVEDAVFDHIKQVRNYFDEIKKKQADKELAGSSVQPVLVAPNASRLEITGEPEVILIDLNVDDILYNYLTKTSAYKEFSHLKPNIIRGGANILNLKKLVEYVDREGGIVEIDGVMERLEEFTPRGGRTKSSLDGLIERGKDFDLLVKRGNKIILNGRGYEFVELSEDEHKLKKFLREYINLNPIHTKTVHGLCLFVESVYEVLLYHHPARREDVKDVFIHKSMKEDDWKDDTRDRAYNEYAALAEELLLVHRIGDRVEITPYGLELVGALQSTRVKKIYHSLYKG